MVRTRETGVVLVFGEDATDTKAIAELLTALCPELAGRVISRLFPPLLIKNSTPTSLPGRVQRIAAIVAAESVRQTVTAVVAHEDTDAWEPSHKALLAKIEEALSVLRVQVFAAVPAWETEAWLFLWPEAAVAYRPSWRLPDDYVGRNVGRIANAKERYRRALRTSGRSRSSDYRPTDAPGIARKVRELGVVRAPRGQSDSFEEFVQRADRLCASL